MLRWWMPPLLFLGACATGAVAPDGGPTWEVDFASPIERDFQAPADLRLLRDLARHPDLADDDGAAGDDAAPAADLALAAKDAGKPGCTPKINEAQTEGAGGANDEFVELYNPCGAPVELGGYKLVYRSAMGAADVTMVTFPAGALGAAAFLVCGQTAYPGKADQKYAISMATAGGSVGLRDGGGALVDALAWGTAKNGLGEGTAAPAVMSGNSLQRHPDGADSDDNSADFHARPPTPRAANQ